MIVSLGLHVYGLNWGLPSRWNVDEEVIASVQVLAQGSVDPMPDKPPLYRYVLAAFLIPFFVFQKIAGVDLAGIRASASISWIQLALDYPDFATRLFLYARLFSACLGTAIVYVVYRLGALLFGRLAGLFGAAILAVTQGFVISNHYARSETLVNFLAVVVVYLCLRGLRRRGFLRHFYAASILAGLATTAKINGAILLAPVMASYVVFSLRDYWRDGQPERSNVGALLRLVTNRSLYISIGLMLVGMLLGFGAQPSLLVETMGRAYTMQRGGHYGGSGPLLPVALLNYTIHLVSVFGIANAVFIFLGVVYCWRKWVGSDERDSLVVVFSLLIPYFIAVSSVRHEFAYTKLIILIVPFLAVFGGSVMGDLWMRRARWRVELAGIIVTAFLYSFSYSLAADYVLARKDIRYEVTSWMRANIPRGSSVEVLQQPGFLFSEVELYPSFDFVYFGNHSKEYRGSLFHPRNVSGEYVEALRRDGPTSEYFIVGQMFPEIVVRWPLMKEYEGRDVFYGFFSRMCRGEYGYTLVKAFYAWNWSERSELISGLSYPHSLVWYPTDWSYVPTAIFVFRRSGARVLGTSMDEGVDRCREWGAKR